MKARDFGTGGIAIYCPACKTIHYIAITEPLPNKAVWQWNGSYEKPTISPSLLIRTGKYIPGHEDFDDEGYNLSSICHSFIEDGMIKFCGDSTHALSGQTVELPDVDVPDQSGVYDEIEFWKGFVKTPQFATWTSKVVTPELDPFIVGFIKGRLEKNPASRVLDIASGACSVLNGLISNNQLVSTDLLAKQYAKMIDYDALDIVLPIPVSGENLDYTEEFDIVHVRNGLDHCEDIKKVFDNMMRACKSGGVVIIQGFVNEADAEGWIGMHQHNIDVNMKGGGLRVTNKVRETYIIGQEEEIEIEINPLPNGKTWFMYIGQKK